jgi:AraC-like DNA-binding protein
MRKSHRFEADGCFFTKNRVCIGLMRRLGEWAVRVAMSERSLTRLMVQETGLTFGKWRRHGPEGIGRSRPRIRQRLHRHVQEGAGRNADTVLLGLRK